MQSEQLDQLFTALAMAQGEGMAALKDSTGQVGTMKTKYADLASCWDACRAPLAKHGLCVVQQVSSEGPKITVHTTLGHKSGQFISSLFSMTSTDPTPRGMGSAITYARRYSLCPMVGISPEDDDGEAASRGTKEAAQQSAAKTIKKLTEKSAEDIPQSALSAPTPEFSKMMEGFQAIKAEFQKIGKEDAYYQILGAHGFEKSNQIRPLTLAREIYKEMGAKRKELIEDMEGSGTE